MDNTTSNIKKVNQDNYDSHLHFLVGELLSAKRLVQAYKVESTQWWQAISVVRSIEKSIQDYKAIFGV
jgi:hypothetical protein